ncbi:hypothetical protein CLF_108018, partial [Clonorchis sinensis]
MRPNFQSTSHINCLSLKSTSETGNLCRLWIRSLSYFDMVQGTSATRVWMSMNDVNKNLIDYNFPAIFIAC